MKILLRFAALAALSLVWALGAQAVANANRPINPMANKCRYLSGFRNGFSLHSASAVPANAFSLRKGKSPILQLSSRYVT